MSLFTIETVTELRRFPAGTVKGPYRFRVVDPATSEVVFGPVESDVPPTSFEVDLAPGEYVGVLSRNDVTASAAFTVAEVEGVDIDVPVSVTITLADVADGK